jgi:hypothetical protein
MKAHKSRKQKHSLVPKNSKEYKELMLIRKTMLEAQRMLEDGYRQALEIDSQKNKCIIMVNPNSIGLSNKQKD